VEAIVEYKTVRQLENVAEVTPEGLALSRTQRLERWAELLERDPDRKLNTFFETEYESDDERAGLRRDDSPISVAFVDPVLRAAGLQDDSYGQARKFFDVSDWELHRVVCYCHYGVAVSAGDAARTVRMIASYEMLPGVVGWARRYLDRLID
jgi:hypothetical protein